MPKPNVEAVTFTVTARINLANFAAEYGVDEAESRAMAREDAWTWLAAQMEVMNETAKWSGGIGHWHARDSAGRRSVEGGENHDT